MDYIKELNQGRTLTIIPSEENKNWEIAVFWKDLKPGIIYTWSREIGLLERSMSDDQLIEHFNNMTDTSCTIFARGYDD